MKILFAHDDYGIIHSLAVAETSEERRAGLRFQRGEFVAELEEESVPLAKVFRAPRKFCEEFRFDRATGKLIAKNQGKA